MAEVAAQPSVDVRPTLRGNRWMLAGAILYLLEFVAIIGSGIVGVGQIATVGTSADDLVESYVGHVDAVGFMAGWFALVLLGRILIFIGLRAALRDSGRPHLLMDFAVVASAVSVTLEVAAYALASAAADLAATDDTTAMVILDRAAGWMNLMIGGGLAVAILASVWCMWRTGLFSPALNVVGLVAGLGVTLAQLTVAPATLAISDAATITVLLFWVWMIWAGVVLWRRTPAQEPVVAGR